MYQKYLMDGIITHHGQQPSTILNENFQLELSEVTDVILDQITYIHSIQEKLDAYAADQFSVH